MRIIFRLIGAILSIIQGLLWVRFVLKLFGATGGNAIIAWIYKTTALLISPVAGTFPSPSVWGFVFELTTLFAILLYAIVHFLIGRIIRVVDR